MEFSLIMEIFAVMILCLLMIYSGDGTHSPNFRIQGYRRCLLLSLAAIGADVASVWGIRFSGVVPLRLNILLSSVSYLAICVCASYIGMYLLRLIFEHIHQKRLLHRMLAVMEGLLAAELVLVICNFFTGCLFYFQDNVYCRGPLNCSGYLVVLLQTGLIAGCYVWNHTLISDSVNRAMRSMPYVLIALIAVQLFHRNILMNGMMTALVNLIIFLSFQSSRIGVDCLTDLGNRNAFTDQLSAWMRRKHRFHAVLISLNNFDQVNRQFGERNGDEFLYAVARYLDTVSGCSRVYRLGNVKFAMLCANENCPRPRECVRRLQKRFREPWDIGDIRYRLTASYADVVWDNDLWNGAQVIERLEYALNLAKKKGENSCVQYDDDINFMMERERYVTEQMCRALEERSFEIYYQPVYCLETDSFPTAEALIRLSDQKGNMISPAEFIPIAEETGMIREISWLVVEKVCRFLSSHRELNLECVSINMSVQQFVDENMVSRLEELVSRYGISHCSLKLELTERTISENTGKVANVMEQLLGEGIRFCLDDFGVGYSNFSSVLALPFDTVKLDKSLTDKVTGTERERQFVRSIIAMFKGADYNIIAEGAEREDTIRELRQLHVDKIQGFYYAKPLPEQQFLEFIGRYGTGR